jgi:hypothetical protein
MTLLAPIPRNHHAVRDRRRGGLQSHWLRGVSCELADHGDLVHRGAQSGDVPPLL